ncbi:MAG: hypothetical protein ACHP7D_05750 [Lysobacterales bacterium]
MILMGQHTTYVLAWLLPLFAGGGLYRCVRRQVQFRGDLPATLGNGWVLGVFMAAVLTHWTGRADTVHAWSSAAPWLGAIGVLAWIGVVLRARRASGARVADGLTPALPQAPTWRIGWWFLLALIVVRLWLLGDEASLRPVFPWDAWSAWAAKPKAWMLVGHADAYVSMLDWLAQPQAALRTAATWNYPELLAWLQVWFASGAGGWNEPLVDLAWCGALAAFALAAYGGWRGLGLKPIVAIGLAYALVSLPLIDAHVALAGYADLWVAVTLGLAVLAWSRWLILRERGQWWLGVGLALCLPAIKLEGAIWLLGFSGVVALDLLPRRWRLRVAGGVAALGVVGLLLGGFALPMLGLGWVHFAWGSVTIPSIAFSFELTWHRVGGVMLASLFTLPNWHLLWYVFPLLVALRWRILLRDHAARMLGLLVLLQLAFLFVLFFFTSAAAWAEDFTSANRLILQIVPCVFVFVAALLRDAPAVSKATDRSIGSPAPIAAG